MRSRIFILWCIGVVLGAAAMPQAVQASAQPSCSAKRVFRIGTARTIYTHENGGYTTFVSKGGVTYGVDPNSIPEELMNRLKPNGPALAVTVAGRTCEDRIFYIERVFKPVLTQLRPYTP